ncbi:hypothetical protein FF1_038951 [Malus domestica]
MRVRVMVWSRINQLNQPVGRSGRTSSRVIRRWRIRWAEGPLCGGQWGSRRTRSAVEKLNWDFGCRGDYGLLRSLHFGMLDFRGWISLNRDPCFLEIEKFSDLELGL